jgi:hypothetical protein
MFGSRRGKDQCAPSALSHRAATLPPWIAPIGAALMILNGTPPSSGSADPARSTPAKKEYTFHIDLGIEFLFHFRDPE